MNDRQVAFRLPGDLVDKIDEKANALRQQTPGMRVTRADVVRAILVRGLDEPKEVALIPPTPAQVHGSPVTSTPVVHEPGFARGIEKSDSDKGVGESVFVNMSMDED
jgi:hypothetical protein